MAAPSGRLTPQIHLQRAAYAAYLAALHDQGFSRFPVEVARQRWPDDSVVPVLIRGVSAPASVTGSTWASTIAASTVGEFYGSLGPLSAAARLINAGTKVSLDGISEIAFPRSTAFPSGDVAWIAEGAPIPVRQLSLSASTLGPMRKLATIAVVSAEVASFGGGEAVVTQLLRESAGATLDAAIFSNAAASSSRPAGLLNGISATTATAGGGEAAMLGDVGALLAAIANAGGSPESVAIIAAPAQAGQLMLRLPMLKVPVWSSRSLAAGTIVAIDIGAFASAFGAEPEIRASKEGLLPFEDSSPLAIASGTQGSGVLATPAKSLWQSDLVSIRLVAKAAFVMRAPGLVAHVASATW